MYCSNCGSQVNDDAAFCPSCGQHLQKPQIAPEVSHKATAEQPPLQAPKEPNSVSTKKCPNCGAVNEKSEIFCVNCKAELDKLCIVRQSGKKIARVTCPGCGEVYTAEKNKVFIVLMLVFGIFFIELWPIALTMIILAIVHATGGLQGVYIKQCPHCRAKYSDVRHYLKKSVQSKAKENSLILLTNISAEELATPLNEREKLEVKQRNLYHILTSASVLLFMLLHFIRSDLEIDVYISSIPDTMLIGDILLNFAGPFQAITFFAAAISLITAFILNQISIARYKKIALVSGMISASLQVLYAISVFAISEFTASAYVWGETVYFRGECETTLPGILIILSAAIMAISVYAAYKKEVKLQRLILRAKNNL
ncbi:MAG: zinc ribbon domain-containing protein [Clostridia bacterium]|nr:zinc ribbon domain-containing protein [Clostridia bacterium]